MCPGFKSLIRHQFPKRPTLHLRGAVSVPGVKQRQGSTFQESGPAHAGSPNGRLRHFSGKNDIFMLRGSTPAIWRTNRKASHMTNDRFGMGWGMAGGTTLASVEEAREAAILAEKAGFDSFWISHAAGVDSIAALGSIGRDVPGLSEVGTSVVPIYGRHPVAFAQLVRTAQNATGGRLTLGIGTGNQGYVEDKLGLSFEQPYTYAREFIDGLEPLLNGTPADTTGSLVSAHAELDIEAIPTPILLAALGPRMLRFAGSRLQGTTLGQCGPRTIASYILPHLREGAESSGRKSPLRVLALVRICVTDDTAPAKALAREISAHYQAIPSYAEATKHEGLDDPSDLHLIGTWPKVLDGLADYGEAGATDLRVQVVAPDDKSREATYAALEEYLS